MTQAETNKILRRKILAVAYAYRSAPKGGASGPMLVREVNGLSPRDVKLVGDEQPIGLIRDLIGGGYVEAAWDQRYRNTVPTIEDVEVVRITAKGVALKEESIGPDPMVDDDRETTDRF